jgi:hypothetical protein
MPPRPGDLRGTTHGIDIFARAAATFGRRTTDLCVEQF